MALPVITFNTSTGSDTAASGAGPATALSGANAALAASTTITLSVDSPDLSGVATDGSAVIYVASSSGLKWFKITAVDNTLKTVTVANAATPTESGKAWAIGGKRATLNATTSRLLLSTDIKPGWIVELEDTQSITSTALTCGISGDTTSGPIIVRGASGVDHPIVTSSADAELFTFSSINNWQFRNLQFKNSNATRSAAYGAVLRGTGYVFRDVVFGDATNKLLSAILRGGGAPQVSLIDCEIKNCTGAGVPVTSTSMWISAFGCYIHDNTSYGIQFSNGGTIENCIICGNGNDGISQGVVPDTGAVRICGNTVYNNTGDGLDTSSGVWPDMVVMNNSFSTNGNYGWRATSGHLANGCSDFNNYYGNTSGTILNATAGANDIALDPTFTNAGGADFSIGTNLKAAGFPLSSRFVGANKSATKSYVDIGAAERQESSSSGGGRIIGGG